MQEFLRRLDDLPPFQQALLLYLTAVQWLHAASDAPEWEERLDAAMEALSSVRGAPWVSGGDDEEGWWFNFCPPLVLADAARQPSIEFVFDVEGTGAVFSCATDNEHDEHDLIVAHFELARFTQNDHHICWDLHCGFFRRLPLVLSVFLHGLLPVLRFMQDNFASTYPCLTAHCQTNADADFLRAALASPGMPRVAHLISNQTW